jgi:glutaconate CoA-transferase subunit A
VPFLPTRAGLGSDVLSINPDLKLVRSPYGADSPYLSDPADADVDLVAMPALRLDAAIVHTNRADTAGNGQILGPDAFFDPLFLGAADRRFVTTERVVENGALTDEGPLSSIVIHRMMTDGVAQTPRGAHFTANPPDYGRDEAFQKEYAAAMPTSGPPSPSGTSTSPRPSTTRTSKNGAPHERHPRLGRHRRHPG